MTGLVLALTLVAGCGSSSPSSASVSAPPASSRSAEPSPSAAAQDVRVTATPKTIRDPHGVYTITEASLTVSGVDRATAQVLVEQLETPMSDVEDAFARSTAGVGKDPTPYTLTIDLESQHRWGTWVTVVMTAEIDLHGAHNVLRQLAVTADVRTGEVVDPSTLFTSVAGADTSVRKTFAVRGHLGGVTPSRITIGDTNASHDIHVSSYPSPAGLVLLSDQCSPEDCVVGPAALVLPWTGLPLKAKVLPAR
jgi:hypothetical protein